MASPKTLHTITKGLNLPITGEPEQVIYPAREPRTAALLADDYVGMKPTLRVAQGDRVKRGQVLFEDKKSPGVCYTAPAAGTVIAINRGEKRSLQSVVIELSEAERSGKAGADEAVTFAQYTAKDPAGLSSEQIKALLLESGLWTAFRTRPFSKAPDPATAPHSIFVTAMDTNPLAPSVNAVAEGRDADFRHGLVCVAKLTEGRVYLCRAPGTGLAPDTHAGVTIHEFEGVHPAGTVGLHIHLLDPVHRDKTVWHLDYQDAIAIGRLFRTGTLDVGRVISLAGPSVRRPRLLRTRWGASTDDLVAGELAEGEHRVISGSVLSGRTASGPVFGYLGRHHSQVSVLREDRERVFLGWLSPGNEKFSLLRIVTSRLRRDKKLAFTTTTNGSVRAMVPIGMYERVMPMDVMPTFLLRAMLSGDLERAEQLGCLELDEEDLALCTFVCPSKIDYGPVLRKTLAQIAQEG